MNATPAAPMCNRCVLSESPPDITLDAMGVCSICRDAERTPPGPASADEFLESDFTRLLAKNRGKFKYDVLVMCSGGKDSTSSLCYMVKRYHLNPLAFTFDHGFESSEALENVHRAVDALGVDFLYFRSLFMKDIFARIITSGSRAVICHLCSMWYMMTAFDVAARYDIPIVIAGWTKGQTSRPGVMSKCACKVGAGEYNAMSQATRAFLTELRKDRKYRDFPQSMEDVLERARRRHKSIVVSPHWFLETHADEYVALIGREVGWRPTPLSYPAGTTNCSLNFVSMYLSLKNYGYTHYHAEMSNLIRGNFMTRAEALEALAFDYDRTFLDAIASRLGVSLPESSASGGSSA